MSVRRRQFPSLYHLRGLIVPEPVFAWFEAGNDGMTGLLSVSGAVPAGRAVAATNVSAFRAAAQVQPPAVRRKALHTAGSARLRLRIDSRLGLHTFFLSSSDLLDANTSLIPSASPLTFGRHCISLFMALFVVVDIGGIVFSTHLRIHSTVVRVARTLHRWSWPFVQHALSAGVTQ